MGLIAEMYGTIFVNMLGFQLRVKARIQLDAITTFITHAHLLLKGSKCLQKSPI